MKKLVLTLLFLALSIVCYEQPVKSISQPFSLYSPSPTYTYSNPIDSIIDKVLIRHGLSPYTRTLIISQARVESGEYTSNLFVKHRNLFAMRHPRLRPTKSRGNSGYAEGRSGYASFSSIEDSVEDLILYLKYFHEYRDYYTTREYVVTLKLLHFFEAPKEMYISSMEYQQSQIIKQPDTIRW